MKPNARQSGLQSGHVDEVERALRERIGRTIEDGGGWIGFDRFMQMALYERGLGYYVAGRSIFGQDGDFVTAPEMSPLFGATLARQIDAWLDDPAFARVERPVIYEFGAGTGALAAQILVALAQTGRTDVRYCIVETSPSLRHRQRELLGEAALTNVEWLDELPASIEGVVLANEVLDAIPVRVAESDGARWCEMGVVEAGGTGSREFGWMRSAASDDLLQALPPLPSQASGGRTAGDETLPVPYRTEVSPQMRAWVATLAGRIQTGAMLLIDYGFPAREYYHPQRAGGTLMMHHRHHAHADPFVHIGAQDITAHVDFSAVRVAAEQAGMQLIGYVSQARFLVNAGVLDVFAHARTVGDERTGIQLAQGLQKLVSEAEMGELFKVIAFRRGLDDEAWAPGFADGDRSQTL